MSTPPWTTEPGLPRRQGLLPPPSLPRPSQLPVVIPGLLGEAILSSLNTSQDTWDQSVGGTLIERRLIDWTAAHLRRSQTHRMPFGRSTCGLAASLPSINLGRKRIAGFASECLLLGAVADDGVVPLLQPDEGARPGEPVA